MNRRTRRRRRFITLLTLTIIILVGLFTFSNLSTNQKVDLEINKAPAIHDATDNEQYASYNNNLIISNGSLIKVINAKGKEELQTKFFANDLNIKTNNKFALLSDINGDNIILLYKNKVVCKIATEKIVFTKLLDNGDFIIGHSLGVEIYNNKGERQATVAINYYALDAIGAKNKLVVTGFTAIGKSATGVIVYYDTTTGNEIKRFTYNDEIFPELRYKSSRVVAITDNKIIIQKTDFEEAQIIFDNKNLMHYYITTFGRIQCFFSNGSGKTIKETYSLNGQLKNTETLDINIQSFAYSNDGYSLLGDNNLLIYNSFGWLRKITKIDKTIGAISQKGIYIIENSQIKYVSF